MGVDLKLFQQYVSFVEYFSKGIHIKNKFYTRVRKAVRQVNAVIDFYYPKKWSQFEFSIISKLVAKVSQHV